MAIHLWVFHIESIGLVHYGKNTSNGWTIRFSLPQEAIVRYALFKILDKHMVVADKTLLTAR